MQNCKNKLLSFLAGVGLICACTGENKIDDEEVVEIIHVAGITLEPVSTSVKVGETVILQAVVSPDNATNQKINWTSSDSSVASIEDGTVTGIKIGNATIVATTEDGGKTAMCQVSVINNLPPSVTLDVENVTSESAILGGEANLNGALTTGTKMGILWSADPSVSPSGSNKTIATDVKTKEGVSYAYSYSVTITGLEAKTVYYYRSFVTQDGQDSFGEVKSFTTGTIPVQGVSLNTRSASIKVGESITLIATVSPENSTNKNVSWTTSDSSVATVEDGTVKGIKPGNVTITVTTEDGSKTDECSLAVLAPSVTMEAEHISAVSVVLKGKANIVNNNGSSSVMLGFQYYKLSGSTSPTVATILSTNPDDDYNYSVGISGLEPNTSYSYWSFVRQNGQDIYGEVKEFTTKDLSSLFETKDASDIKATSAILNAKLDLTDVQYDSIEYGFFWGVSETSQNYKLDGGSIVGNLYAASLTKLSHKTQYWYKAYVRLDSQTYYGEVKTFTTDVVPVESVSLDKSEYTFHTIGNTLTLNATVLPSDATDKSVEWSSDKEDVAAVDANGRVIAKANGKAIITVTTKDQGKTASCEVTVSQWVTGITLDKSSVTLNEGESYTLIPTVNPNNAAEKKLAWTSFDESIAKVDAEGKITAVSKGTATIKATATDGSGKYASCSVVVKRLVSSIQLNKTTLTLYRGGSNVTETLTATVNPSTANNTSATWTSSNPTVATVSSSGVVTGKTPGTATITVTANDGSGVSATCQVEVKQYVTSITLSKTSLILLVGADETISVTSVLPDNANDKTYTWSSSDNSIASVDDSGKVTARANGNATIKATANDGSGVFASCSVIVFAEKVDMGIKTSDGKTLYWSTRDLCESGFVSSPEVYGDYYAWGETATKSNYSWSTYKFGTSEDGPFSKYNTISSYGPVDNKTVLEPGPNGDDVASKKLGGSWRMPTDEEWSKLIYNCTWTWTTNYNGTGVKGTIFTAPNGNSIFFPAAGYWSSSLIASYPCSAWYVYFYSYDFGRGDLSRCCRLSVRPVTE